MLRNCEMTVDPLSRDLLNVENIRTLTIFAEVAVEPVHAHTRSKACCATIKTNLEEQA